MKVVIDSGELMSQLEALGIDRMSTDERLRLLGEIWESLLRSDGPPPVPAWHLDELRQRIAAADANPGAGISLEDLRRELRGDGS